MTFSRRTDWDLSESPLAGGVAAVRASGRPLFDLTVTNPTQVGLTEPLALAGLVADALADPRAARYEPEPFGLPLARAAVAASYAERGTAVDPARVVLGASTSEAYAWLFKLLADPGDDVLVPSPSYPLFGYLAALEGVTVRCYPLDRAERFRPDAAAIERMVGPRTRAVVLVQPNNPTGTLVSKDDARRIDEIAAGRGLAVISDEVFLDFVRGPLPPDRRGTLLGGARALTFVMSGLSKECCAPQLKLGWTIADGPSELVAAALRRLELVADTYLSVGTAVQLALPRLLAARASIQRELCARLERNHASLFQLLEPAGGAVRVAPSDGGWTALLEVPRVMSEEAWVRSLAEDAGVLVQPGYFFDLDDGGTLVVSLLVAPGVFDAGVSALVQAVVAAIA